MIDGEKCYGKNFKVGMEAGGKSGETPEAVTGIRWRDYQEDVWRKNGPGEVPQGISSGVLFFHTLLLLVDQVIISPHTIPWVSLNSQQVTSSSLWASPRGVRCKHLLPCIYFQGPLGGIFLPCKRLALYYAKHSMGMSFLLCARQLKPEDVY